MMTKEQQRHLRAERKDRMETIRVLTALIVCEVDSSTTPIRVASRLLRDIEAIPARYVAVLAAGDKARSKARR